MLGDARNELVDGGIRRRAEQYTWRARLRRRERGQRLRAGLGHWNHSTARTGPSSCEQSRQDAQHRVRLACAGRALQEPHPAHRTGARPDGLLLALVVRRLDPRLKVGSPPRTRGATHFRATGLASRLQQGREQREPAHARVQPGIHAQKRDDGAHPRQPQPHVLWQRLARRASTATATAVVSQGLAKPRAVVLRAEHQGQPVGAAFGAHDDDVL
mmetsp:Transcript_34475/g.80761  ORF Transcript_34475/g.80761 Transcript_34475/m.80761 type:complete len:215 (+) Transcript_34475:1395-2039(+)